MSVHAESSSAARPKARKAVHPDDVQHATDAGLDLLRVIGRLVLHNVSLPSRPDLVIDHVVAGPSGVYVINTIAPTGSVTMSGGLLVCAGQPMTDEIDEVAGAAGLLRDLLSGAPVAPILCFQRSSEVAGVVGEVAVCSTENILELLSSQPDVVDAQTQRAVMRVLSDSLVQVERREQKAEPVQPSKPRHRQKVRMLRRSHQDDPARNAAPPAVPPVVVPPVVVPPVAVPEAVVEPVVQPAPPEVVLSVVPPVPVPDVAAAPRTPSTVRPEIVFPEVDTPSAEGVVEARVEFGMLEALVAGYASPAGPLTAVPEIVFPTIDAPSAEEVVETRVEFEVLEALVAGYEPVVRVPLRVITAEDDVTETEDLVEDSAEPEVEVEVETTAEQPVPPVATPPAAPARPVGRAPARPAEPVEPSAARPPARLPRPTSPNGPVEQSVEQSVEQPVEQPVKATTIWRSAPAGRPRAAAPATPSDAPVATSAPAPTVVPAGPVEAVDADPVVTTDQPGTAGRRFTLPRVDVRPALKKAGGVLAHLAPAEPVESVSALRETAVLVREEQAAPESSTLPAWAKKPAPRQDPVTLEDDAPRGRRFSNLIPAAIAAVVVGAVLLVSPEVPAAVDRGIDWGKGLFAEEPPPVVGSLISVGGTAVDPAYDVTASGPVPVRTNGKVRSGHRLVAVKLRVHNNGSTKLTLPVGARMQVFDALGIGYPVSTTVKRTNLGPSLPKVVTVGPGATLVGSVVFSVPKGRVVDQVQLKLPDADDDALAWVVPTD